MPRKSMLNLSDMAFPKKVGFSCRAVDHITDELVCALSGDACYEFKDLFLKVYEGLKLKKAVSGGEEMLRLRCHEKLQRLINHGLAQKTAKTYGGLKGIEQASSVHQLAKANAAIAARVAAAS